MLGHFLLASFILTQLLSLNDAISYSPHIQYFGYETGAGWQGKSAVDLQQQGVLIDKAGFIQRGDFQDRENVMKKDETERSGDQLFQQRTFLGYEKMPEEKLERRERVAERGEEREQFRESDDGRKERMFVNDYHKREEKSLKNNPLQLKDTVQHERDAIKLGRDRWKERNVEAIHMYTGDGPHPSLTKSTLVQRFFVDSDPCGTAFYPCSINKWQKSVDGEKVRQMSIDGRETWQTTTDKRKKWQANDDRDAWQMSTEGRKTMQMAVEDLNMKQSVYGNKVRQMSVDDKKHRQMSVDGKKARQMSVDGRETRQMTIDGWKTRQNKVDMQSRQMSLDGRVERQGSIDYDKEKHFIVGATANDQGQAQKLVGDDRPIMLQDVKRMFIGDSAIQKYGKKRMIMGDGMIVGDTPKDQKRMMVDDLMLKRMLIGDNGGSFGKKRMIVGDDTRMAADDEYSNRMIVGDTPKDQKRMMVDDLKLKHMLAGDNAGNFGKKRMIVGDDPRMAADDEYTNRMIVGDTPKDQKQMIVGDDYPTSNVLFEKLMKRMILNDFEGMSGKKRMIVGDDPRMAADDEYTNRMIVGDTPKDQKRMIVGDDYPTSNVLLEKPMKRMILNDYEGMSGKKRMIVGDDVKRMFAGDGEGPQNRKQMMAAHKQKQSYPFLSSSTTTTTPFVYPMPWN